MDIDTIRALWPKSTHNAKLGAEWWDGRAEKFSSMELPNAGSSLAMRIIEREKMAEKDCAALDVGCGGGRYAFVLEAMGANVTATDFSQEMIARARANALKRGSAVNFSVGDWHTLDLRECGWNKKFDLVLANMTPAVCSVDTFLKLSEASRGWVLMVKPTRQTNSVLDALNKLIGAEGNRKELDETLICAFSLAWLSGGCPRVEYDKETWENDIPLDTAVRDYSLRIASSNGLAGEEKCKIEEYLKKTAVDGIIHETVHTTLAALYWRVDA